MSPSCSSVIGNRRLKNLVIQFVQLRQLRFHLINCKRPPLIDRSVGVNYGMFSRDSAKSWCDFDRLKLQVGWETQGRTLRNGSRNYLMSFGSLRCRFRKRVSKLLFWKSGGQTTNFGDKILLQRLSRLRNNSIDVTQSNALHVAETPNGLRQNG